MLGCSSKVQGDADAKDKPSSSITSDISLLIGLLCHVFQNLTISYTFLLKKCGLKCKVITIFMPMFLGLCF